MLQLYVVAVSYLIFFALAKYLRSVFLWRARSKGRPLPPGPPGLPLIGNLFDRPTYKEWEGYRDLSSRYGDILHLRIFGQSIVVLSSADVMFELLDKRSATTSDRKDSPMIELTGSSLNMGFMRYGDWWRQHRRMFWQHFNQKESVKHRPAQIAVVRSKFLEKLLQSPTRLQEHIRYTFAGAILKVAYGINVADEDDEYISVLEAALEGPEDGLTPGRYLVEFLPFLRYIPTWFPGAHSQRLFAKWQAAGQRLKNMPYEYVRAMIGQPEVSQSVVGRLYSARASRKNGSDSLDEEEIIKDVGAVAFLGGSDTIYSTFQTLFLAMSLYPDILAKAHAELDAVVGPDRLPDFNDRESLVYINAICKEALRWQNVIPLGVQHCTTQDEELRGYFIPAGSIILSNVWACMHDPDAYEDPFEFRPERFIRDGQLDPTARDPVAFVFGFGRRICPGRYLALDNLFINAASVLHVFDIGPPLGEGGQPIKIKPEMSDGFLSFPEDCRCTIKPRSPQAEALISAYAKTST
ncbi:cytochrome P450 [Earliella scabrosa]|nr:cytochrome P450 [Earliella scabrosa]